MSAAYDERLAAAAPAATRAEKQEGYDIDLLNEQYSGRGVSVTPPPLPVLSANHAKAEAGDFTTDYARPAQTVVPWYKTRKWLLIFLLGGAIIVAAIIGGAVGGTVGHKHTAAKVDTSDSGGGGAEGASGSTASNGDGAGQAASRDTSQLAASSTTEGTTASSIAITGLIPTVTVTSSSNEHDHGNGGS